MQTSLKSKQLPGEYHMLQIKQYFELTNFKLMRFLLYKVAASLSHMYQVKPA